MPSGTYPRTEYHIEINRQSHLGLKHTEKQKKKISEALKRKMPKNCGKSGEKSLNWKNGISKEENYHSRKGKEWYCKNKERAKELQRNYYNKNREKVRYYNRVRRWKRLLVGGHHTKEDWLTLKEKYQNKCLSCKKEEPEITLSVDHIIPILLGGRNDISNIQPLCRSCNSKKNIKIIDYRLNG